MPFRLASLVRDGEIPEPDEIIEIGDDEDDSDDNNQDEALEETDDDDY